ncbi:MAG: hypothetical protein HRU18_08935 [Pseudoalteromonas sp.]|uniref:hypothetical protein n=1 Tax=Pseudoalteromonas sp. TaxID=53249 RepID=UPI001DAD8679|nr:hypothetical protein [Pseudoalteromonas sp.]NRA78322.1 hypothetical protein [Pseudoalteromonas sp.]
MAITPTTIIKSLAATSAALIAAPQSAIAENLAKANWQQLITMQFNFTVSDMIMLGTFFLLLLNYLHNRKKTKSESKTGKQIEKSWERNE